MGSHGVEFGRLQALLQQAGTSDLQDDPKLKGELLKTLDVTKREIEGPAAYLSRVRQAVRR